MHTKHPILMVGGMYLWKVDDELRYLLIEMHCYLKIHHE